MEQLLKNFLKQEMKRINCFYCKELAKPLEGKVTIIVKQNKSLKAIGKCSSCNKEFSKFYKVNDVEALKSIVANIVKIYIELFILFNG